MPATVQIPRLVAHRRESARGGGAAAAAAGAGKQGRERKGYGEEEVQPAGRAAVRKPWRPRPEAAAKRRNFRYSSVHMKSLPAHSSLLWQAMQLVLVSISTERSGSTSCQCQSPSSGSKPAASLRIAAHVPSSL